MAINYNVNPYYDDYDETKQFYRILFRPGRAVQARELTQIQTSIQKQIERFGQGIYKDGSVVVPGSFVFDQRYYYLKLTSSYGSNVSDTLASSLIGETITGANSNVSAIVINSAQSTTDGDPTTIFVKYTKSNTTSNTSFTRFFDGETITNVSGNITLQVANTAANGNGSAFSVTSGVIFTKGIFAYFDDQTLILDKYNSLSNTIVGFEVTESTVESTSDTSLLDPAVGASNYVAPGADRYKISLDLAKRPFTYNSNDDPNFIEIFRIEDSVIISQKLDPQYSILGDTLARRTFDESGNYIVRPYGINIIEHLRTSNTTSNGYFYSTEGGDANKLMAIISPGKSYVKGYEVENIRSKYLPGNKARNFANVNNGIISTTIGNYIFVTNVFSVPDLSTLPTVNFYNRYNTSTGTANGTAIGTGRIRGMELYSGTPGSSTAIYKLWLFDVAMNTSYVFEDDVKQLFVDNAGYSDFTCDISPNLVILSGSVSTSNVSGNGSNVVVGVASRFDSEVEVDDFITIDSVKYRVTAIANSSSLTVTPNVASNLTGTLAYVDSVEYNDNKNLLHLFEFPYSTIKTVDPTNLETSYDVKRIYATSLSNNTKVLTAGTDETFDSISTTDYILVVKSGANAGQYLNPSTFVSRASGGGSVTINLTSLANSPANVSAYATADVALVAKLTKTNTSADKKLKTLVSNATVDYTDANTAQATVISLAKADIYRLVSVKMANVAFGSAYSTTNEIDITSRYTLDDGQRPTYYGVGKINLKPNQTKPTGPIRITFDYFTHGTGDYFSVDSYSGIDYKDIPTFFHSGKIYQLRDCLDFRPRINDAGTGFSGTGAVVNDFLDPASDVLTDYSYYLPKADKIVIDKNGLISFVEGISSLNPREPNTPTDTMALFVLKQKAYVFDVKKDIEIVSIENRRYTMRDIGRIENRVKNLEYYTSLNLLEQNTQSLQIQDSNGFDRFKNGFIVDNFTGHGIGDVYNRDYGVSIDYFKKELRPMNLTKQVDLDEVNTSFAGRTANNYVLTGDLITLPYSNVAFATNDKASTTENINPYSIVTWIGTVTLDPPSDIWFDQTRLPTIERNENGNYDQFLADAQAKGTYGTVWGNWSTNYYGSYRTEERTGIEYTVSEQIDTRTDRDVVVSSAIIPKMRSIKITFTGEGLKANTKIRVFFDNINVTNYCKNLNYTPTTNLANTFVETSLIDPVNLITNEQGSIVGEFDYISDIFNLNIGEKRFILTDSPTNGTDFETFASTSFTTQGELQSIRDEVVSTRNAVLNSRDVLDRRTFTQQNNDNEEKEKTETQKKYDVIDAGYAALLGRPPDAKGKAYWTAELDARAKEMTKADGSKYSGLTEMVQGMRMSDYSGVVTTTGNSTAINLQGSVGGGNIDPDIAARANKDLHNFVSLLTPVLNEGIKNNEQQFSSGSLLSTATTNGATNPAQYAAATFAVTLAAANEKQTPGVPAIVGKIGTIADKAVATGLGDGKINSNFEYGQTPNIGCPFDPLAQSFFVNTSLFVTKVDLYFSAKDLSGIPMRVQLRRMINGVPGSYIVPFSEKVIYPSEITTSDDGSTATTITFESPVYLDTGEYALVLLSESLNYRVWISQIGQTDVLTNRLISEQPYIGVLFKSQNASTWNADQFQDLKFTLYRASFNTSVTGIVDFNVFDKNYDFKSYFNGLDVDPLEVYPNSNIMRIYHPKHGQNAGSYIKVTGFPLLTGNNIITINAKFYGINVSTLESSSFAIDNTTLDSYTITLPQAVDANVTSTTRTGGGFINLSQDFKYDTYYPAISTLIPTGTSIVYKIKTTADVTYSFDATFTTISISDYNFDSSRTLASNVNKQLSMSNTNPFVHRAELTTVNEFVSPVIDTKQVSGIFARNLINNPTYDNSNFTAANDIITVASANNISVTQISGAEGRITLTNTQDKINAVSIIKGTYLNISANNGVNNGQYRVLNVTDNGANISIYNVSTQNVSTNAMATYTITNGRNFVAEEAAYDGSAFSKYITREVSFINPCTAFKFYLDVAKPTDASLKFYYKISEVGDTTDLKEKEYTEITSVTVPTSLDDTFNEVEKIVENLPAFDAIIFKIVFLGDDSYQVPKCKNLRVIALA